MSREKDIEELLAKQGLNDFSSSDVDIANWCTTLANFHLLGKVPNPIAVEFVVRSVLNAGRLIGAAQIQRRDAEIEEEKDRLLSQFVKDHKRCDPEGSNN